MNSEADAHRNERQRYQAEGRERGEQQRQRDAHPTARAPTITFADARRSARAQDFQHRVDHGGRDQRPTHDGEDDEVQTHHGHARRVARVEPVGERRLSERKRDRREEDEFCDQQKVVLVNVERLTERRPDVAERLHKRANLSRTRQRRIDGRCIRCRHIRRQRNRRGLRRACHILHR